MKFFASILKCFLNNGMANDHDMKNLLPIHTGLGRCGACHALGVGAYLRSK
jgi:hypothetical protein